MRVPPDFTAEERLAATWIERLATSDVDALDALYALYHQPLLGLFRAILKDAFEAEEVLQDTFLRAYRQAGRFNPELGTPFTWLATIGKRLAIDRLRRREVRPEFAMDLMELPVNSEDNPLGNVHGKAHQQLEAHWIRDCLQNLSETQREVIEMAFLHGYTHHEIADRLDRPLGTVKSDLYRGLNQLRKAYLDGQ